jgi:hypothetical protein
MHLRSWPFREAEVLKLQDLDGKKGVRDYSYNLAKSIFQNLRVIAAIQYKS